MLHSGRAQTARETTAEPTPRKVGPILLIVTSVLTIFLLVMVLVFAERSRQAEAKTTDVQKQLTDAKNETNRVQKELDRIKATQGDLQSQLDKARADLNRQEALAKETQAQAQGDLDQSKGTVQQLMTQLDEEKKHSAGLQQQIDQGTANASQLQTQLNSAKIQVVDLQGRLEKAENDLSSLQPLLMKARRLPVTTSVEHSGRNYTLHIANLYMQPLSVDVALGEGAKARSEHAVLGAGGSRNFDHLAAGENIVITSDGYDPVKLAVQ